MPGRGATLPKVLYTDRGPGMCVPRTGQATGAYAAGVREAGLRLYTGTDASRQPSDLADVLLHETAIACFKRNLVASTPTAEPWKETHTEFRARATRVVKEAKRSVTSACCAAST